MIRRILILDTETQGLSPEEHCCIEVAVCLYDVEHAAPLASFASLIATPEKPATNPALQTNHIRPVLLDEAPDADTVWRRVAVVAESADVIVAHRADFDRSFTPEPLRSSRPWVCSKFAIEWPAGKPGDHLLHLALAHGVGVVHAHRAMSDVDTLARLFTRVAEQGRDLAQMIERAMRPRVKVRALVSYENREQAKSAGFAWEPSTKTWWKEVFEEDAAGLGKFPFPTQPM